MKMAAFAFVLMALFAAFMSGKQIGFDAGFEAGKAEAKTPAFIVETCSAWWWGSNKEAKKMIDKFCEQKK